MRCDIQQIAGNRLETGDRGIPVLLRQISRAQIVHGWGVIGFQGNGFLEMLDRQVQSIPGHVYQPQIVLQIGIIGCKLFGR